ncbi:MAG: phenylacetate--CoA ligase family protein [Pseudomonadota bacterium]
MSKAVPVRERDRLAAVSSLVRDARRSVAMYRDKYAGFDDNRIGSLEALRALPIVTKEDLRASFPDRLVNERFEPASLYQVATSGTSSRVMVFQDESKRDWDRAADLIVKYRTEGAGRVLTIPPDDCYERCGLKGEQATPIGRSIMEMMVSDGYRQMSARREIVSRLASRLLWNDFVMPAPGVEGTAVGDAVINHYFEEFDRIKPGTIRAFPFYFWMLAMRSDGRKLDASVVLRPSGGKASRVMADGIEQRLGARFRENYGTAELGTMAMDMAGARTQVLFEHLFILEFERAGVPVKPGEIGEMLVTDLRNHASPLIRYAVGDVGRVLNDGNRCGTGQLQFEVCGRMDETIVTRRQKIVTPDLVTDLFLAAPGIEFFRLIQQDELRFLLEVVPGPLDPDVGTLQAGFRQLLQDNEVELLLRKVRRIPPEASGKYRLVQSSSHQRFHDTARR